MTLQRGIHEFCRRVIFQLTPFQTILSASFRGKAGSRGWCAEEKSRATCHQAARLSSVPIWDPRLSAHRLLGVRLLLIKVTIPKLSQLYDQLPRSLEFLPPTIQLFSSRSGSHHELEQHIPRPLRGWLAKGVKQNWSYVYQETKALSRNDVFQQQQPCHWGAFGWLRISGGIPNGCIIPREYEPGSVKRTTHSQ
jgi:hypothetical protein